MKGDKEKGERLKDKGERRKGKGMCYAGEGLRLGAKKMKDKDPPFSGGLKE